MNTSSPTKITFNGFMDGLACESSLVFAWRAAGSIYRDVVRTFAPAFIDECVNRLGGRTGPSIKLVSTGHSLGGGLAQQFAYAHCVDARVPRVSKVYAFDPSPVTGFFSVKRAVRNINRKHLRIDRIYERGEILAIVRSMMRY